MLPDILYLPVCKNAIGLIKKRKGGGPNKGGIEHEEFGISPTWVFVL